MSVLRNVGRISRSFLVVVFLLSLASVALGAVNPTDSGKIAYDDQ